MRLKLAYESMAHRKCIAPSAHYAHRCRLRDGGGAHSFLFLLFGLAVQIFRSSSAETGGGDGGSFIRWEDDVVQILPPRFSQRKS